MHDINIDKYNQVKECEEKLHHAYINKLELVEAVPSRDTFWGTGLDKAATQCVRKDKWPGKNTMGGILAKIAEEKFGDWEGDDSEAEAESLSNPDQPTPNREEAEAHGSPAPPNHSNGDEYEADSEDDDEKKEKEEETEEETKEHESDTDIKKLDPLVIKELIAKHRGWRSRSRSGSARRTPRKKTGAKSKSPRTSSQKRTQGSPIESEKVKVKPVVVTPQFDKKNAVS